MIELRFMIETILTLKNCFFLFIWTIFFEIFRKFNSDGDVSVNYDSFSFSDSMLLLVAEISSSESNFLKNLVWISASRSLQCRSRRLLSPFRFSIFQFRSRILRLATRSFCFQISAAPSRFDSLDLVALVWAFRSRSLGLVVSVEKVLRVSFTEPSSHDVQVPLHDALTWCEALSLKFTEPYYVDFSLNS